MTKQSSLHDKRAHVLILGTADWNATIATNQHYVAKELSDEFDVIFVEGTGTRRLQFSRADFARVLRRIRAIFSPHSAVNVGRSVPEHVRVVSPVALPFHGRIAERLNALLIKRSVQRWIDTQGTKILWTYTPFTSGLPRYADVVTYHLVDLLHENPMVSKDKILRSERELAGVSDLAIATSEAIEGHLKTQGFSKISLLKNPANVELFAGARSSERDAPPTAVFAGNLRGDKVDSKLLQELSDAVGDSAQIKLIGPIATDFDRELLGRDNVVHVPAVPIEQLAQLVGRCSVGLIPYNVNNLTKGVSPLKTYEYLAAGLPVVSTELPSMTDVKIESVFIESSRASFVERAVNLLESNSYPDETQVSLEKFSWTSRGVVLRKLLTSTIGERGVA